MRNTNLDTIHSLLSSLGVTPNYKGFYQGTYAVQLCAEDLERLRLVTKLVYVDVARRYKTSCGAVERNIRTVSHVAWQVNRPLLENLAGRPLNWPLCNAQFFGVLSTHILSSALLPPHS